MPCNQLWGIHDAFAVPRACKSKLIELDDSGIRMAKLITNQF
jgi:hypothetical protein